MSSHAPPAPVKPTCVICGNRADDYCTKDSASYLICRGCGLIFQHPLPTRESMVAWADTEYASGAYRDYVESRPMKIRHFEDRLNDLGDTVKPGRLLDVGCSCGYFLEVAAGRGFDVYGVEFSSNAIALPGQTSGRASSKAASRTCPMTDCSTSSVPSISSSTFPTRGLSCEAVRGG